MNIYSIPKTAADINKNKKKAALEMSRRGFHLLPIKPKDKKPYFELLPGNSTDVFKENKASNHIIKSWFNTDPKVNIGVFAGTEVKPGYKLIIVDFDKKINFGLPITPIVETKRGYHAYFKCRADRLPEAHKTVRGEIKTNGYVVTPPSTHTTGIKYKWAEYLSFIDVGLADFNKRRTEIIIFLENSPPIDKHTPTPNKELNTTININSSVQIDKNFKITKNIEFNKGQLIEFSQLEKVALKIMKKVFDVTVGRIGKAFRCPIHNENIPSAALYRTNNKVIGFKDFHRTGSFYTMPELYYEYKTGKHKALKGATSLIWWIRLLKDAGIVEPPRIIPPKPLKRLSDNQRILYKSFIELLEVQQVYDPSQVAAPFSHRFAADWSGLKYSAVRSAKRDLSKKKYIKKVEPGNRQTRKAGKWSLIRDN